MKSNPSNIKRFPNSFRETFGIVNNTGKPYKDVIRSFLVARKITIEDLSRGYIREPSELNCFLYVIHVDMKTYKKLQEEHEADCIISYQQRTTGNFAMIRLFEKELSHASN